MAVNKISLVALGVPAPLAIEMTAQINGGTKSVFRLQQLGMATRLARELTKQLTAGTINVDKLAQCGMVTQIAAYIKGNFAAGPVSALRQVAQRSLIPSTSSTSLKFARGRTALPISGAPGNTYAATFRFPNWLVTQVGAASPYIETNGPGSLTVTATVEYPLGTILGQMKFGGATSGVGAAGADIISDPINIPTGVTIFVRWWMSGPSGIPYTSASLPALTSATYNDAFDSSAGSIADNTNNLADPYTNNGIGAYYGPVEVVAMSSVKATVAFGDSINHGESDTLDATLATGIICRTLASANIAYINAGTRGDSFYRAINALGTANFAKRASLALHCDYAVVEYGVNDVNPSLENRTAQNCLDDGATFYAYIKSINPAIKIAQTTMTQVATSTDNFATVANQTTNTAYNTKKNTRNDALRAGGITNMDFLFDVADVTETARNSGIWKCPAGYTPMTSSGGLHPLQAGYYFVRDSGVINTAILTA